jgi:hypothetical protein
MFSVGGVTTKAETWWILTQNIGDVLYQSETQR